MIKFTMRTSFSIIELLIFIIVLTISIITISSTNQIITKSNNINRHLQIDNYVSTKIQLDIDKLKNETIPPYSITYDIITKDTTSKISTTIRLNSLMVTKYLFMSSQNISNKFDTLEIE